MSGKENQDENQPVAEDSSPPGDTAAPQRVESEEPAVYVTSPPEEPAAQAESPTAAGGRRGGGVAWLALLLVLLVAGAGAWVVYQGLQREQLLQQQIDSLGQAGSAGPADLPAIEERLQAQLQRSTNEVERMLADRGASTEALSARLQQQQQRLEQQQQRLEQQQQRLDQQQQVLDGFSANDQDSWLRAEAQYLLRLANQRVLMARDPKSAIALLRSADNVLRELGDPGLHEVRAAVAAEIAALRTLPAVDVEGIYLRISALVEQADRLKIFEAPEVQAAAGGEDADTWQTRLRRGYERAVAKLSEYIVIRRRDVPMQALMDPQWEGLVRQNLRMLLEQAQVALLRGNQTLYGESLERARHWVAQFADTDEVAAAAMDSEIAALQREEVAIDLPDLSRSVQALDAAARRRPQPVGVE